MSVDTAWLDIKLGLRMLLKHPGLTLIGVVATSFAIGAGAVYFEIVTDFVYPTLPLDQGARVITIQNEDLEAAAPERRSLYDFLVWRNELESVEDLAAFVVSSQNLAPEGGIAEPVEAVDALMSFTVSQRTREIGIRKALGAGLRTVLRSVFSRAFVQLGLGAGLGALASVAAISRIPNTYVVEPGMILTIMAFMLLVGFLSCVAPVARALRIEPTEAMREDL